MRCDDDDVITVDDELDELTELILLPPDSPAHELPRAIILAPPPRPVLLVMPEDLEPAPASSALTWVGPRPAPAKRGMQLSIFAPRAQPRSA